MKTAHCALMFVTVVLSVITLNADTHYLVPEGTEGNTPTSPYTSWPTAANKLSVVMAAASADDRILVRKGVYDATNYVECKAVTIRSYDPDNGGAINAAETILDGSNYPSPYEFMQLNTLDNSRPAVIEGITYRNFGCIALKLVSSRDTKVLNCIFTGNGGAVNGGAIYLSSSYGSVISNCTFTGNALSGGSYKGAAIYDSETDWQKFVDVIDSTFTDNTSSGDAPQGGAIFANKAIRIRNCRFSGNLVTGTGSTLGGTISAGAASEISGCTFTGICGATYGQAIQLSSTYGIITNCTFTGLNYSSGSYGLIIASGGTIVDCAFTNNTKIPGAFIMANGIQQDLNVRNCLFAGNSSYATVFQWYSCAGYNIMIDNCTVLATGKNILTTSASTTANFKFRNDFLLGTVNTSATLTLEMTNCNTTDNGDFVSTGNGDYRLKSTSPCIDAGTALGWHAGAKDLGGRDRVVGGAADIGCFERQTDDSDYFRIVRAVASAGEKTGDWADAHVGLQAAVDAAPDDSLVEVKSGTYEIANTIVISNRTLDVKSVNPATGTTDREATVLDGKGATRIMIVHSGPYDANDVPQSHRPVMVEGFTFKDGFTGAGDGLYEPGLGGGLLLFGRASAEGKLPSKIVDCRFTGCSAVHGGGAAMLGGVFENCRFDGNTAVVQGGGAAYIQRRQTSYFRKQRYDEAYTWYVPGLIGCVFTNNVAVDHAGGFASWLKGVTGGTYGIIYVVNCGFYGNRVTSGGDQTFGSALTHCYGSTISNCVFKGNSGAYYGAICVNEFTHITDCAFTENAATYGIVKIGRASCRERVLTDV